MAELGFRIGNLDFKNPVLTASGTCGYGPELEDFFDISRLGGIIVKGTTLEPREGNPYPRMAETPSGMLNSVGLQNKGIDYFEKNIYPRISKYNTNVIVNVNGNYLEEYAELAGRINLLDKIPAIELNISCPNVTDIVEFARIVEDEGADSVSLINTLLGMAIDIRTMKPVLPTITGGLSGPAVKPVALRMVWQVAKAVKIPVIGIGGIMNADDALEFIMAGATAVQVGTVSFISPDAPVKILEGIEEFVHGRGISHYSELIGCINR